MKLDEKKIPLHEKLQKAIELELSTIPPYLVAMFSIKEDNNYEPASIIRSVFMEEMLHMLLAANVLSATGGSVKLGETNIPQYPCTLTFKGKKFKDREFDIHLEAFSKSALDTFMKIELPQEPAAFIASKAIIIEGFTIGEFYMGIIEDLTSLCDEFGPDQVFNGDPKNQVHEQYYWGGGGKPIVVTSLETAVAAIQLIIEQGEGATQSNTQFNFFTKRENVPHYYRFKEIYFEKYYKDTDMPSDDPTGDDMKVDYSSVYPLKMDSKSVDYAQQPELKKNNDLFNSNYSMMLRQLQEGFNENPVVFYTAIMNGMRNLTPLARNIVKTPLAGDPAGRHAGPTFEWIEPDK